MQRIKLRQESVGIVLPYLESGVGIRWRRGGAGAGGGRCREPAALVTSRNRRQNLTARGARRMRSEPRVDATHVEAMAALRQHSDFVSGGELGEADRAIGELHRGFGGRGELRERTQDLLLDAFVGGSRRRRRRRGGGGGGEA